MAKQDGQQLIAKAGKFHSAGKFAQAEKIYRQLLKANPNDLTLLRVLGMLERDRRNLKAALGWFNIAKQVSGDDPIILAELALTLDQAGEIERAMEFASQAQTANPTDIYIANFYAKMCLSRGLPTEAAVAIERAIQYDPENIESWHLLSLAANATGTLPIQLTFAKKSIALQPDTALPHAILGSAHRLNGNLDAALAAYEDSLSIDTNLIEAIAGKAEVLISLDRIDEAEKLLDDTPPSNSFLLTLAKIRIAGKCNQPLKALKIIESASKENLSPYHRSNLLMHKGRVLDELQKYDDAWDAWTQANELHHGSYDLAAHVEKVDKIIASTPQKPTTTLISKAPTPIFIVGMFRSGTTLLEQILGAHIDIDTAGEVDQILRFVEETPYPECYMHPSADWQQAYLNRMKTNSKYCTDKMPANYMHIGLIHQLFPNAKIIHTVRNALDTCISCYSNSFSATHAYTSKLSDFSGVYHQYQRIMQYWNETFPGLLYEVHYESLVHDHESTVKDVLSHVGVEFDESCLEFYNVRRIAVTPSADQVRKPIYATSVNRHKNYVKQLGELISLR